MTTAREPQFEAVVFDMDGVLTRTAALHERAWKRLFDDFLRKRGDTQPFSHADYRTHVDGKPRYQGVADFLGSRGMELPRGDPSDPPGDDTVCGLGNRKNQLFLELLQTERVEVFPDAVAALERWRRGGMGVAAISSSRNCRRVLRAVDLERRFEVIVDGEDAAQAGLAGKPEIAQEAARRLGVEPAAAVLLEDATSGVRAGLEKGFGLVVGVSRDGNDDPLREAGAHVVTGDVYGIRFPRWIPNVLERTEALTAWRSGRPLAVFFDFDGTLAPIVDDPADARISDGTRSALERLPFPVAIVSGRDRQDVESRVGLDGIFYAGSHGFDIAGRGHRQTLPQAEEALDDVDRAEAELRRRLDGLSGVILERKRYSLAVHYRQADSEAAVEEVERATESVRASTGLRLRHGKKVVELEPAVDWDKGRALQWLVRVLPGERAEPPFIVYVGDDETDEDAFAALRSDGVGIWVGEEVSRSLADYRVENPEQVLQLLSWLASSD